MNPHPRYFRVLATFLRNSLVRDMTFRANFLIDTISSMSWVFVNLGFYVLIFRHTPMIGDGTGWGKYQFFLFLSTTLLINSVIRGLFLSNAVEFSEQIRTGTLDFALLKPIDTQFLISLGRIEWSAIGPFGCGVAIYYSLMVAMAATSVWLGRNRTLLDFWFYITNFSRYPMEIYTGRFGDPLRFAFTFLVPVLIAVNVPARLLVKPLNPHSAGDWFLPGFAVIATGLSLVVSRRVFNLSLLSYRSASS